MTPLLFSERKSQQILLSVFAPECTLPFGFCRIEERCKLTEFSRSRDLPHMDMTTENDGNRKWLKINPRILKELKISWLEVIHSNHFELFCS